MRRIAVRALIRAGVSEDVAMTITGHKTRAVFSRYNITDMNDQIAAIKLLARRLGQEPVRTDGAQSHIRAVHN